MLTLMPQPKPERTKNTSAVVSSIVDAYCGLLSLLDGSFVIPGLSML